MPHINLNDPCPCEMGKIFGKCCARRNLKPIYAVTKTRGPKTGFRNERCYASELADCSTKISQEHYLSKGILQILDERNGLTVAGLPWLIGKSKKLSPAAFVGNILCDRHNHCLSPLDAVGIRFFKKIRQIDQEFSDETKTAEESIFLFNGYDIERWMLKILCGMVFSGNSATLEGKIKDWKPILTWVNMLFGTQKFNKDCGLYFQTKGDEETSQHPSINFTPLLDPEKNIAGAKVEILNLHFILLMSPLAKHFKDPILDHCIYRPREIATLNNEISKVIVLAWDSSTVVQNIQIKLN